MVFQSNNKNTTTTTTGPKYTEIQDVEMIVPKTYHHMNIDNDDNDDDKESNSIYPMKYKVLLPSSKSHQTKKTKKNKCSYGRICCYVSLSMCVLCFVFIILVLSIWYYLVYTGIQYMTVPTSTEYPIITLSDDEVQVFEDQMDMFYNDIHNDIVPNFDMIISEHILNGYISKSDYLRGHAYITLHDHEIIFETSIPADIFPGGKHRYFASTETLDIISPTMVNHTKTMSTSTTNDTKIMIQIDLHKDIPNVDGPLFVGEILLHIMKCSSHNNKENNKQKIFASLESGKVFGMDILPPSTSSSSHHHHHHHHDHNDFKNKNLLEDWYNDPDISKVLYGIDSIEIVNEQLILHPKQYDTTSSMSSSSSSSSNDMKMTTNTYTGPTMMLNHNNIEEDTDKNEEVEEFAVLQYDTIDENENDDDNE